MDDDSGTRKHSATRVDECIVEIISDSGEGAQTAGQMFGTVSAKMGNGVWTVEIIPCGDRTARAEPAGASGIRIRWVRHGHQLGRRAELVVAFNEQVLMGTRSCSWRVPSRAPTSCWRTSGASTRTHALP